MRIYDEDDEELEEDGEWDEDDFDDGEDDDLGPDERDADLLDGTWEEEYYSGRQRGPDWNAVQVGVALVLVFALLVPLALALLR